MPQSISSAEYARIKNEAERNMGRAPIYTDEDISKFANGTDLNRYPNTNWLDLAIQNSVTTRHGLEASGGTEKSEISGKCGCRSSDWHFPEYSTECIQCAFEYGYFDHQKVWYLF